MVFFGPEKWCFVLSIALEMGHFLRRNFWMISGGPFLSRPLCFAGECIAQSYTPRNHQGSLRWHVCRAIFARKIALSYEISYEKIAPKMSPKFQRVYFVGLHEKKSRNRIPIKFPASSGKLSLQKQSRNSHRRASAGAQGEGCSWGISQWAVTACAVSLSTQCFSDPDAFAP